MNKNYRGFTIVELLVVIVVIGILATVVIVSYTGISVKANDVSVVVDLGNVTNQFKLFQVDSEDYPTTLDCTGVNLGLSTNKCIKISSGNSLGAFIVNNSSVPQTFCLTIIGVGNVKKSIDQNGLINNISCTHQFVGALTATASSRSQINLSWTSSPSASNYTVQKANNVSFTGATNLYSGTNTSTSSTSLLSSTQYYYRVKETIDGDDSIWATATATTLIFPVPVELTWQYSGMYSIGLSWGSVSNATGYTIKNLNNSSLTNSAGITTEIFGLNPGTTYSFQVRAYDAGGNSNWSSTIQATTAIS